MQKASEAKKAPETARISGTRRPGVDPSFTEDQELRAAWAKAWLREYRCHTRYLSLLAVDTAAALELRFAWLDWWDAACVCREAARRLEYSQGHRPVACTAGRTMSETCEPRS
jgi:hypothetical protein